MTTDLRLECLDDRDEGTCRGTVEYRMALSATGVNFPRCETHWGKALKENERITSIYGGLHDSPGLSPPSWFDPLDAGERWDDEY